MGNKMKYVWLNYFQGLKRPTPFFTDIQLPILNSGKAKCFRQCLNSATTYSTGKSLSVSD